MIQLQMALRGRLNEYFKAEQAAVQKGIRGALRATAFAVRRDIRRQMKSAGLGKGRLQKALNVKSLPASSNGDQAVRLRSYAVYPQKTYRPGGKVDLISLFSQGATIRAANMRFLAIPTPEDPMGRRGMRARPEELVSRGYKLHFAKGKSGGGVLITEIQGHPVVTHVLRRQVTLRKRLDTMSAEKKAWGEFPGRLSREINRAKNKVSQV